MVRKSFLLTDAMAIAAFSGSTACRERQVCWKWLRQSIKTVPVGELLMMNRESHGSGGEGAHGSIEVS